MEKTKLTDSGPGVLEKHDPKDVSHGQLERVHTFYQEIDPALDRAINRKFDLHIVPWLFALWLLAFIDRSNIGNARIDGLTHDLRLGGNGNKFNIALTIFYIPYILIDVPSNWFVKRVGAGYYLPGLMLGWGIVGLCTGFVKSYASLLVCRFFLGLCEGGLLGGMVLYLSMFYRRHDMIFRIGLFYCAAPLSGAIGGLLATGLAEIQHGGYNRWPWIFIVEGIITIVVGIITIFFLPNTPNRSRFLTQTEREAAILRMQHDAHGSNLTATVDSETFSWRWVRMAVFNINTWLLSMNFFAIITPIYSFSLFLPTIISSLGYARVTAQLFTVPPNIMGFVMVILGTFLSDKIHSRGLVMIGGCSLAIIGYIMLLIKGRPAVHYGGTFFVAAGIFASSPSVMGWLNNNLAPHYVRATGTGLQLAIANCAAFIATFTYLKKDAYVSFASRWICLELTLNRPDYTTGHSINIGMLGLSLILSTTTIAYAKYENRKRENGERDHRLLNEDPSMLGYRHPDFRYTI